jgi:hypothetical protein
VPQKTTISIQNNVLSCIDICNVITLAAVYLYVQQLNTKASEARKLAKKSFDKCVHSKTFTALGIPAHQGSSELVKLSDANKWPTQPREVINPE